MKKWWISWYCKDEDGAFELNMPWWISGERADGAKTICAAVKAQNEKGIETIIYEAYDIRPAHLEFRFCNERADDWSPFCDRFPKADWMIW